MGEYAVTDVIGYLIDFIVIYLRELSYEADSFAGLTILMIFLVILPMALITVVILPLTIIAVMTKGFGGRLKMPM